MTIPFSNIDVVLKQVPVDALGPDERAVLNFFASRFTGQAYDYPPLDPDSLLAVFVRQGLRPIIDDSVQRRFAGDATLPRSRYFTVCRSRSGDDGGTLVNELKAYWNGRKSGYVGIVDSTVPSIESEHFGRYLNPGKAAIFYVVHDSAVFPSPFGAIVGIDRTTDRSGLIGVIPVSVVRTTLTKVIDLRVPETADWFTHELTRLKTNATGLPTFAAGPLDDFARLLPALMSQIAGGGVGVTQFAGLWLRRLGANGLIFPSARCDVVVDVVDGKVVDFTGWNFVDYRGAGDPLIDAGVDLSTEWPTHPMVANTLFGSSGRDPFVYSGTTVERLTTGLKRGSLTVQGLEEQLHAMQLMVAWNHFVDGLRELIDANDVERFLSALMEAMIAPSGLIDAKVTARLCNLHISAALGDSAARVEVAQVAELFESKGDLGTAQAVRKFLMATEV